MLRNLAVNTNTVSINHLPSGRWKNTDFPFRDVEGININHFNLEGMRGVEMVYLAMRCENRSVHLQEDEWYKQQESCLER